MAERLPPELRDRAARLRAELRRLRQGWTPSVAELAEVPVMTDAALVLGDGEDLPVLVGLIDDDLVETDAVAAVDAEGGGSLLPEGRGIDLAGSSRAAEGLRRRAMSDAPDSGLANTPVRPSLLAPHRSPMPIPRPIAPMAIPSRDRPAAEDAVSTHPAAPAVDLADLGDALLAADIARLATGYDVPAEMPLLSVLVTSATALGSLIRVGL
eukprot:gene17377-21950_t